MEIIKFFMDVITLEKKVTIDVRTATIPFLIEIKIFLTANIKPRKNALMA